MFLFLLIDHHQCNDQIQNEQPLNQPMINTMMEHSLPTANQLFMSPLAALVD